MAQDPCVHSIFPEVSEEDLDEDCDSSKDNLCWGRLKGGRRCTNRTRAISGDTNTSTIEREHPAILPTCRIHNRQQFKAGLCQARLQCGASCNAKFRWEPYGFSLCSAHTRTVDAMPCYFLKIPTELRCRIYSFLLPDQTIPARFDKSFMLRSDRKPCYPHVLRVNHQIYAEAAVFLYAQNTFEIEVSGTASIHMCNSSFSVQSFPTPNPARLFQASNNPFPHGHQGNHALQDYQMQLMLLEQQNKKRLFMARQEKDNVHHIPLPQPPPSGVPLSRSGLGEFTSLSLDPNSHLHATTWHPGNLSHANIDMIRSFQINILFPNVPQPPPTGLHMQYIQQHQILQQQMAYRQQQAQMAVQQALAQQQQAQMGAQPQNLLHQQQQATVGNMLPQPPHLMGLPLPPTVSSFAIQASAPLPPNPMSYILTPPVPTPSSTSLHPPPPQRMPWASALLERLQYETCDALNQIVGRLQLLPLPILRLNLSIYIHEYEKQEPAVTTAQLFLNTFRVLRNVVCPNVDKIMWADQFWRHTEIFHSLQDALVHPTSSSGFVNRWKAELSQQSPVPDPSPVVHAYWVLHYICFDLQAHHEAATVMASSVELHTLLLHAKMARESEDMIALRDVGQKIQNIWKTYILKQRAFESRVSNKVAFMGGLLGSDDVEPLPMDSSSSLRMDYEGKGKGRADDVGHHFRNDALPIVKDEEQEEYPNMIGGMHLCN